MARQSSDHARWLGALSHAAVAESDLADEDGFFISDEDGYNIKQITDFGCASFAPTFTPDGKKILFSSNKHDCDGRKFELYLINTDGTGLEQITDSGGFTAFPEFSPDGKKVVFASDRGAKQRYEFNIFTADWK